jgi:peptidyl-prolyl cis-trans isomerase C
MKRRRTRRSLPARLATAALGALAGIAVLASARTPRAAVDAAEQARRDAVVARAGGRTVTVGQLENILAVIPRYQLLDSFGATADAIRHKVLDTVAIPDLLYAAGAADRKLTETPEVARRLLTVHAEDTERAIEKTFGPVTNIPLSDVRAYFDTHKEQFDQPLRIGLWRILCATPDEARAVLAEAQKDGEPKHFGQLAREHSKDMATKERGGDLGLIQADGTSSETGVRVDPALFAAAAKVKDGQFVPEPVPEQGMYAVVWRRGTLAEKHKTFEESVGQIREQLAKQRFKDAVDKLIKELRAAHVRDLNEAPLDGLEIDTDSTAILGKKRPGQVAPISQIGQRANAPLPKPRMSPSVGVPQSPPPMPLTPTPAPAPSH